MSQKPKLRHAPQREISPLRIIEGLLAKRTFNDALYQAKKLVHEAPTVEHWALLRKVYLAQAEHLCDREQFVLAHPLLTEMENLPGNDAEWWEKIASFRAGLGDWATALKLLGNVPDAEAPKRIMGVVADRALRQGTDGVNSLPPDLRDGFDHIIRAFEQYEKNRDEEARQTLQAIGSQSPFLEWKLMLRGLMAYSAGDDARAIENWQRLNPKRLPSALIAGLRYAIDASFRAAQPQNVKSQFQQQLDGFAGSGLTGLRRIQRQLVTEDGLPDALQAVQAVVSELKRTHPQFVQKLANCFYWAIYNGGEPEDLKLYRRAFGPPVDDPDFARLEAMVMDKLGNLDAAHKFWQNYERWIGSQPERWPGEQGNRARAIIWEHMGQNARIHLEVEEEEEDDFPSFLDFLRGRRPQPKKKQPLKPGAEECFQRAWELAPNWDRPAGNLFDLLVNSDQLDKAEELSRRLLEQFPNEVDVLTSVGMLHEKRGNPGMALQCLKTALHSNPLDRTLRGAAAVMSFRYARELAIEGKVDDARGALQEALSTDPGNMQISIRCLWAACEFKWKNPERANQLLAEAQTDPAQRLMIAYRMVVEGGRLKLPKPNLATFQKEFADGLAGHPPAAEVFPLAAAAEMYRQEPVPYRGLLTHEKKIAGLVQRLINSNPTESELEKFGIALLWQKSWRLLKNAAYQGLNRFPENPFFYYFLGEIELNKKNVREYDVVHHLKKALKLVEGSSDDRFRFLRESIDRIRQEHPDIDELMESKAWFGNYD